MVVDDRHRVVAVAYFVDRQFQQRSLAWLVRPVQPQFQQPCEQWCGDARRQPNRYRAVRQACAGQRRRHHVLACGEVFKTLEKGPRATEDDLVETDKRSLQVDDHVDVINDVGIVESAYTPQLPCEDAAQLGQRKRVQIADAAFDQRL